MTVYFLDMGLVKYGDCIVIIQGDRKILIDYGKPGDNSSLQLQLKKILQQDPPFHFNLLVMTHNHDDHIGFLPEAVDAGDIIAEKYLLADPAFRWGRQGETDSDSAFTRDGITEALLEEDHSSLPNEELELFLSDIEKTVVRYRRMIKNLRNAGANVLLFRGRDAHQDELNALENEFSDFGLKIIGPTANHLDLTQAALLGARDAIADLLRDSIIPDTPLSKIELYRRLFREGTVDNLVFIDVAQSGGSINNESMVIKVSEPDFSVLLAGDMQFAKPAVTGVNADMKALLQQVFDNGPYDVIKTCHHSSDNGLSPAMLDHWIEEGTTFFVHSGGKKDIHHPDAEVLAMLKERKSKIKFARTDRNGIIKAEKENGLPTVFITKGTFNNFTQNTEPAPDFSPEEELVEQPEPRKSEIVGQSQVLQGAPAQKKENIIKLTSSEATNHPASDAIIELTAKIPASLGKVTITVETGEGKKKEVEEPEPPPPRVDNPLATGGRFDNLLFVTNSSVLTDNIGTAETTAIIELLQQIPGTSLLDLPTADVLTTSAAVIREITAQTKGIVIIGGYDVIPSAQLNVISDEIRRKIDQEAGGEEDNESDDFIIWCDDIYGDKDGDFLPELPVSRIPDGKSASLLMNSLQAPSFAVRNRFGIRNLKRPFAIDVFDKIPFSGSTQFEVSEQCSPKLVPKDIASGAVYFMLHGSAGDATRFSGEKETTGAFEAFDIYNVPNFTPGTIVFSGCCYGALIALPKADRKEPNITLRSRTAEQSIALAFLLGSANAFVGCTGAHYSPKRQQDNFLGKPMHLSFWAQVEAGVPASQALFNAKKEYATKMPHKLTKTLLQAMEMKTLHQFTCLGLGW